MSQAVETIAIRRDLYDELRLYCDSNGIRLRAFIEDSLETATDRDEMEQMLSDANRLRERMAEVAEEATQTGFACGVLATALNLRGYADVSRRLTPKAVQDQVVVRPVTGGQLSLFNGK